jgi:hypothetical protein
MPQEQITDGDDMFAGFASRLDPGNLKPTMLQSSFNMRLQRGIAQPRKGTKRLSDSSLNSLSMVGSGVYLDSQSRDNIVQVFSDRMYLFTPPQGSSASILSTAIVFPANRTIAVDGVCDVVQALNKIYIFRGKYDETIFTATESNPAIANGATGTITITTVGNHGYATGDEVTVRYNVGNDPRYNIVDNYVITVTGNTTFTFQWQNTTGANLAAYASNTGWTTQRGKPPLIWTEGAVSLVAARQNNIVSGATVTGITRSFPCADFGVYFQNRMIMKTDRYIVAASDILSEQTDLTLNSFTINDGSNDTIVGVLPWVSSQFLVFMAKSIYVVFIDPLYDPFTPGSVDQSQTTVVTTEIGCVSRRSIVSAGQFVYFLSANGVQMLTPQLDLKLIGNTVPLSEPISDFFDNVNYTYVSNAVSAFYGNRFYMAVPWNVPGKANIACPAFTIGQTQVVTATVTSDITLEPGSAYSFEIVKPESRGDVNYNFLFGVKQVTATSPNTFSYSATAAAAVSSQTFESTNVFRIFSRNNRMIVYNTLNQAWESIDYFQDQLFLDNLLSCAYVNQRRLMILINFNGVTQNGGVFLAEEQPYGDEFTSATGGSPTLPFNLIPQSNQITESTIIGTIQSFSRIDASVKTREYTMGSLSEKRYNRAEYQFNNVQNDSVSVSVTTYDPDASETVMDYTFSGTSDGTLRPRIAARGSSADSTIIFVSGRPALKSVAMHAIVASRPMISQE